MIGVVVFRFSDGKILKELFKDTEIPKPFKYNLQIWLLNHYFPDYIPANKQIKGQIKGYPDFRLNHNSTGEEMFVEFKSEGDGLRKDQLEFIFEHRDKCFVIFYEIIKSEFEPDILEKIKETTIKGALKE